MKNLFLLIIILFCCTLSTHAAIANAGSCSATGTSCTLSATATGDLNVFWAYHAASATVPTLPAGMTSIGSFPAVPSAATGAALLYCKIASSGSDTGSGTATNATAVAGLSYSGVNAPSNLSASCAGMGVGVGSANNATASTSVTFNALTLIGANNWVAAFTGDAVGSSCIPTGMTSRSVTGDVTAMDTNGTVSSWSSVSCSVTIGAWINAAFVIQAPAVANGSGPLLKRAWTYTGETANDPGASAASFKAYLEPNTSSYPRKATTNDLAILIIRYPSAATLTVNDSTGGSNTWTNDATITDATLGTPAKFQIWHSCLAANTTSITPTFGSAQKSVVFTIMVAYNTTCSTNPVDGTPVCADQIVPTTNFGSTIQSGSITTTVNNDMVLQAVWDENNGDIGFNVDASASSFGDNQLGLFSDGHKGGYASQFFDQATAGAVNPGFTFVQSTHETFASCSVAYKQGSGGTAPGTGIAIVRSQAYYVATDGIPTLQFPTNAGNAMAVSNETGTSSANLTTITDSSSDTWNAVADTVNAAGDPQFYYVNNFTPSNNLAIVFNHGTIGGSSILQTIEISGCDNPCLDTGVTAGGSSQLTATNSGATQHTIGTNANPLLDAPTAVPGTGKTDLFVAAMNMGTGPASDSPTMVFDWPYGTGLTDSNQFTNGDGEAHAVSNASLEARWNNVGTSGTTAMMAGFKQAPSSAAATSTLMLLGVGR